MSNKITLSIEDANDLINDKGGRIHIYKRIDGRSIPYQKDITLPYDIFDDVEKLFNDGLVQVRVQHYTDTGQRPMSNIDINNPNSQTPTQPIGFAGLPTPSSGSWEAYELRRLNEVNAKLEADNERLKDKVDEQKDTLSDLKEQVRFKDKEHLLEREAEKVQAGNSLGGIVDKVSSSPQLMDMISGIAMKVFTPQSNEVSQHTAQVTGIEEVPPADDSAFSPHQNKLVEALEPFVLGLSDEEVNQVYAIIHYISLNKAEHLEELNQYIHTKQQDNVRKEDN